MRRPRALLAPRVARLVPFALLAFAGSLQWVRYVDGAPATSALKWAAAGTLTGALVLLAGRSRIALAAAALAGALLAIAASGISLHYLEPNHVDELGAGISRGAGALSSVRLPYLGRESWVLQTVELSGAALCWVAALLACWPGGRARAAALVVLLVLAAAPVVSLGADSPVLLGGALAALVVAFLWLERLARRPGLSLAGLILVVAFVAVPVGTAADREDPWFDYKAFSERLAGGTPVAYDWNHQYGPIDWGREGVELFRVEGEPRYWRVQTLNEFDGRLWGSRPPLDDDPAPADDLPAGPLRDEWELRFSVRINLLETEQLVGSGTTLAIADATQDVETGDVSGQFVTSDGEALVKGDSYTATAYVPSPTPGELGDASVEDPRRLSSLALGFELPDRYRVPVPGTDNEFNLADATTIFFPAFGTRGTPVAAYEQLDQVDSGDRALRASAYSRTWRLAQRLKRESDSPYAYALAVNSYLQGSEFEYTERPPRTPAGEAPLEDFLLDSRRGYCQQFSGAMALLLRMGGVPARIAAGFTPGGRPSTGEWVVRDTDAHSWVEVWFDGIGWVTFDPTPAATPARSQTAAIAPPSSDVVDNQGDDRTGAGALNPGPGTGPALGGDAAATGADRGSGDGGLPLVLLSLATVAAALLAAGLLLARRHGRRVATAEGATAELERALRRAGRAPEPPTTLSALERRLGASEDGYLHALRAARYRPGHPGPTPAQRAAFRRSLAAALGRGGRVRALYALPPTLPRRPR